MSRSAQGVLTLLLLGLLGCVVVHDTPAPLFRSSYDNRAPEWQVQQWLRELEPWPSSPMFERFRDPQRFGAPDWSGEFVFGKFDYRISAQICGDTLYYISWGTDEQVNGGAWFAVGEGRMQEDGRWFSVWSCLDLSRAVSNGGGAWFEFSPDRRRIFVRYYHDTLPFGESPIEEGEAVHVFDKDPKTLLEGRVRTQYDTREAEEGAPFVIWGRVVDEEGNGVAGAAVKRRAQGEIETTTDARGFFKLELEKLEALTLIGAGKLGYANGTAVLEQATAFRAIGPDLDTARSALATITLRELDATDHRDYRFVSPHRTQGADYAPDKHLQCGNCHVPTYNQWKESRHANSATNPWVRAAFSLDARPDALARGDSHDRCTPCHSPSLAATLDHFDLHGTTLLDASGVHLAGNHCDFCHKIETVANPLAAGLDGAIRLLRPDPQDDTFPGNVKRVFGPLPDVTFLYMGASYNPIFEMGVLCAGCHENEHDGLAVQGTWSEWRKTKYAQPGDDYTECQGCHMPRYEAGKTTLVENPQWHINPSAPRYMEVRKSGDLTAEQVKNNGLEIARYGTRYRPLNEARKHTFVGSDDAEFLASGIEMKVESHKTAEGIEYTVTLENTGAGHAIPTGHGLKRYVLLLETDGELVATAETKLPAAERVGEAAAAKAGVILGKNFRDQDAAKGDWQLPWWRAAEVAEDSRLWPDQPRSWRFVVKGETAARFKLILRRGPPELLKLHGYAPEAGLAGDAPRDLLVHQWPGK